MKRIFKFFVAGVLMSALCVGFIACDGDDSEPPKEPQEVSFYYYEDGTKHQLEVLKDRVIVKTASPADAKVLCENEIFTSEDRPYTADEYVIGSIDPTKTTIEDVRELQGALSATYGLENDYGFPCWPTDKIFVRPLEGTSIESVIRKSGLARYVENIELTIPMFNVSLVSFNLSVEHILWASSELFETGLCEYAEPNFIGGVGYAK